METKKCLFCEEEIKSVAIKCEHCGNLLNEETKINEEIPLFEENKKTTKKQEWYHKKGIIIILCIFVLPLGLYAFWKHSKAPNFLNIVYSFIIIIFAPMLFWLIFFVLADLFNMIFSVK